MDKKRLKPKRLEQESTRFERCTAACGPGETSTPGQKLLVVEGEQMHKYLNCAEAAEYLGVSTYTLQKWRWEGTGPDFVRVGGKNIRYTIEALEAYVEPVTDAEREKKRKRRKEYG